MTWLHLIGLVVPVILIGWMLVRFRRASAPIEATVDAVEAWLVGLGFERVDRWSSSMMTSSLHMVRDGVPQLAFFLGHRAIHADRVDQKLLGRTDTRLLGMWWLHVGVTLPEGQRFPVLAMRRRHAGTAPAWSYLRPDRWDVVECPTGDAEFDELFEIFVDRDIEGRELLDHATRQQILGLRHDPYFDNLLWLVSEHRPDCLTVVNPPLPSEANPTIAVVEAVVARLGSLV
jgi:hypothetical protein